MKLRSLTGDRASRFTSLDHDERSVRDELFEGVGAPIQAAPADRGLNEIVRDDFHLRGLMDHFGCAKLPTHTGALSAVGHGLAHTFRVDSNTFAAVAPIISIASMAASKRTLRKSALIEVNTGAAA